MMENKVTYFGKSKTGYSFELESEGYVVTYPTKDSGALPLTKVRFQ